MARSVNVTIPNLTSIQIKLVGNWAHLDKIADHLQQAVMDGYNKATSEFARKLLYIVQRSMATGTPPPGSGVTWQPLAPSTLKRYGQHNIYYLTGLYARSIGIYQYKSRTLIGLPINMKKSSQGHLTLNQLAKILEFGSEHIPARPLWAPSLKTLGGRSALRKTILLYIRRELSKYGIKPNQVKW